MNITANLWSSAATFRQGTAEKATFILLNQFDLTVTVLAMHLGFTELNPFVRLLLEMPALMLVIKLFIPVIIAWLVPGRLLLPSIALLVFMAAWNIKELLLLLI